MRPEAISVVVRERPEHDHVARREDRERFRGLDGLPESFEPAAGQPVLLDLQVPQRGTTRHWPQAPGRSARGAGCRSRRLSPCRHAARTSPMQPRLRRWRRHAGTAGRRPRRRRTWDRQRARGEGEQGFPHPQRGLPCRHVGAPDRGGDRLVEGSLIGRERIEHVFTSHAEPHAPAYRTLERVLGPSTMRSQRVADEVSSFDASASTAVVEMRRHPHKPTGLWAGLEPLKCDGVRVELSRPGGDEDAVA